MDRRKFLKAMGAGALTLCIPEALVGECLASTSAPDLSVCSWVASGGEIVAKYYVMYDADADIETLVCCGQI